MTALETPAKFSATVTIRLDEALARVVGADARRRRLSVSDVVREILAREFSAQLDGRAVASVPNDKHS